MTLFADIDIPTDHPSFAGHFPGQPILPGVVLIDEALHAMARLSGQPLDRFALASVKFTNVVRPGEPVVLLFQPRPPDNLYFTLMVSGRAAAKGVLTRVPDRAAGDEH